MRSTLNHQPWLKVICLRINICLLLGLPGMHRSNPCPITSSKVGVNACGGMMTTNRYPYHCPINRRPNDIPHGAHTASYSSLGYYGWTLKHIGILRPMTMETRCCNFSYQNYSKNNRLRIRLYRPCGQFFFFLHKQLTWRQTFGLETESTHGQPVWCVWGMANEYRWQLPIRGGSVV